MNEIFIVTGNKGGVGKSFLAAMLADYILRTAPATLICSDSEAAEGQATFCNILLHNKDLVSGEIMNWNLGVDSGFEEMANAIEKIEDKKIVIDTGASMLSALTKNIYFLSELQKITACKIKIIFVVGALPDSAVSARQYISCIHDAAVSKIDSHFILISPTEDAPEKYIFYNKTDIKNALEKLKMKLHFYGSVRQDFFDFTMKDLKLPKAILANAVIPLGTRIKYHKWLEQSDAVIGKIIEEQA